MNKRRERVLEAFLYITFPIALFAGCTGLGNTKNEYALSTTDSDSTMIGETLPGDFYDDYGTVPLYFGTFESDATEAEP